MVTLPVMSAESARMLQKVTSHAGRPDYSHEALVSLYLGHILQHITYNVDNSAKLSIHAPDAQEVEKFESILEQAGYFVESDYNESTFEYRCRVYWTEEAP